MLTARPVRVRLSQAEYFLSQYRIHCSAQNHAKGLNIAYFDAFLFSVASLVELASPEEKLFLANCNRFQFFVAIRNLSAHHSIPAAKITGAKFPRVFYKISADAGVGATEFLFNHQELRDVFDGVARIFSRSGKNLRAACEFLDAHEKTVKAGVLYLEMAELVADLHMGLKV
jgi:hypothetical protein